MAHNSDAGIAAVSRLLRNGAPVAGDAGGGIALLAEIRLTRPLATVLRALRLAAFVDALDKLVARHRARLGSAHPSAQGEELLAQQLGRYFPMLGDHGSVGLLNPVAEDGVLPPDQAHSVRFHPRLEPRKPVEALDSTRSASASATERSTSPIAPEGRPGRGRTPDEMRLHSTRGCLPALQTSMYLRRPSLSPGSANGLNLLQADATPSKRVG